MKFSVISPHRDDVAFSLHLTVAALLEAGHCVNVISCFTVSEYAPYARVQPMHAAERIEYLSEVRRHEDGAWMRRFNGGVRGVDLKLEDAPLRLGTRVEEVCSVAAEEDEDGAAGRICQALRVDMPDALLLPLGVGAHVDHLTTRNAGLEALRIVSDELPCALYEDLPYAARPHQAETIEALVAALGLDLQPVFVSSGVTAQAAENEKYAAARCYPTQVDEAVMREIAAFCRRYDGRERLWANAAWRTSALAESSPARVGGAVEAATA